MHSIVAYALPLLAQLEHEGPSSTEILLRGLFAFGLALILLVGSIWLLLSMILGGKLAYWLTGSVFFGSLLLLSAIWVVSSVGLGGSTQNVALGPKGPDTVWHAVGVGPELGEVELDVVAANSKITGAPRARQLNETYDVSDYPSGEWLVPTSGEYLADLSGANDTLAERASAEPSLSELVNAALTEEGRAEEGDRIKGPVSLVTGEFQISDIRFKEAEIDGKESILALGRAVPSARATAQEDLAESTVVDYLVAVGDEVSVGTPILNAQTEDGNQVQAVSDVAGRVLSLTLNPEERVRGGLAVAIVDLSGQPGAAPPVEVAAVRVRGSLRTPALVYLLGSLLLFAVHMGGLGRAEAARKAIPQPA